MAKGFLLLILLSTSLALAGKSSGHIGLVNNNLKVTCPKSWKNVECGMVAPPQSYTNGNSEVFSLLFRWHTNSLHPNKPTLFVIPGGPGGRGDYLLNSKLSQQLQKNFNLFVIEPRGTPLSSISVVKRKNKRPIDILNHKFTVTDIKFLQEALIGNEPAYILGHSHGGTLGAIYAGLFPQKVSGFICLNCSADFSSWNSFIKRHFEPDYGALRLHKRLYKSNPQVTEVEKLWQEADQKSRAGDMVLKSKQGKEYKVFQNELRNRMYTVFQYEPKWVINYLKAYIEGHSWLYEEIDLNNKAVSSSNSWQTRTTMLCGEILSESLLAAPFYPKMRGLNGNTTYKEAYGCSGKSRISPNISIDMSATIANISSPTLIISGSRDFIVPTSISTESFKHLSLQIHHQFFEIPGANHYLYNGSHKTVNQKILDFFNLAGQNVRPK